MDVFSRIEGQNFVWDSDKATSNIVKHGVSFTIAARVFFDSIYVLEDATFESEEREAAIGFVRESGLLFVVHVHFEHGTIRIISAREATKAEEKIYANQR